jgi:alginate O-acetyltransferase complex protein AlgI
MLFNSAEFIFLFLPLTLVVYFWLIQKRWVFAGKGLIVLLSLFFYAWWNVDYLPLIIISILVNYSIGTFIAKSRCEEVTFGFISIKVLLFIGVGFNLVLLAYYKYAGFFEANVAWLVNGEYAVSDIVLPLAISFFTFTQIAYLVDSYRGQVKEYDFLNYSLFVLFFPHLIAGPVVHHREIMPQFASVYNLARNFKNIALGLVIFSIGLFKKVVIADVFAEWATKGFDGTEILNFFEAWSTSLSYTFQIYFDFSGYTDMAIGAALLFNIRLPINFNSPYKACNIRDFWRRWHITLSKFLRDYLYIPLGGDRNGRVRTYANLMATFVLGGLWHGATWMFVLWGALHGLAIAVHRLWRDAGLRMPRVLAWLITFNFINVTWVFFRADDLDAAFKVLGGMIGLNGIILPHALLGVFGWMQSYGFEFGIWIGQIEGGHLIPSALAAAMLLVLTQKNSTELWFSDQSWRHIQLRHAVGFGLMAAVSLMFMLSSKYSEFIYFNF